MTTDWKVDLEAIRAKLPNKREIIRKQRIMLRKKEEIIRINSNTIRRRPLINQKHNI